MVLLFCFLKIHPISFSFLALFTAVLFEGIFPKVSTGTGRSRRRILRVWGLGYSPQQAWKAGAVAEDFSQMARHMPCLLLFVFKKFSLFCETKRLPVPYYPYRGVSQKFFVEIWNKIRLGVILVNWEDQFFWKKFHKFWTFSVSLPYYLYRKTFRKNSSGKDETKMGLVSYQYYEEKNSLENMKQNRGAVSLQLIRGFCEKNFPRSWDKSAVCVATT